MSLISDHASGHAVRVGFDSQPLRPNTATAGTRPLAGGICARHALPAATLTASNRTHRRVAAPTSLPELDIKHWVGCPYSPDGHTGAMNGDDLTEYALRRGYGTMDIRSPGGTEHLPGRAVG